jgi:tRNA-splicing ligase RtcB
MQRDHEKWVRQMGSLGGGCTSSSCLDESEPLGVLHLGAAACNCIGQYFIAAARGDDKERIHLPDRDLGWFARSKLFDDYVEAVGWAQDYALANRSEMLS